MLSRRLRKMAVNEGTFGHSRWAYPVLAEGSGAPAIGEEMVDANRKRVDEVAGRTQWYTQKQPIAAAVTYRHLSTIANEFALDGDYPGDKYYVKLSCSGYTTKEFTIDISEGSESVVIWSILPTSTPASEQESYDGSVSGAANGATRVELLDGNGDRRYITEVEDDTYEISDVQNGHYILRATQGDIQLLQLLEVAGDEIVAAFDWPAGNSIIRGVVVDGISGRGVSDVSVEMIRYLSSRPVVTVNDVTVYDGDTEAEVASVDAESGMVVLSEIPSNVPTIVYHYLQGSTFAGSDMAVS
jgi:hypothetical protein